MYDSFLNSVSAPLWKKVGLKRRAGVTAPLFSIYSKDSIGIGDLNDLKLLIDWAKLCGMSIVQLLPMNDVGFHFIPYNAQSTFALEPMYLSLDHLNEVPLKPFRTAIRKLRRSFPPGGVRVHYDVKRAKLELLWVIFKKAARNFPPDFRKFIESNQYWLKEYALFKTAKEIYGDKSWEDWPNEIRTRTREALRGFENDHREIINFHVWIQWQLFYQFKKIKEYAHRKKMLLMGDLPFLAARDSADVWSHPNYFKLDFSSGAPPDAYFAKGQRWGMPPYNWPAIGGDSYYRYLAERLRYAQEFYDAFRIDHSVGFFRIWSIPTAEPMEHCGLNGAFDPRDEKLWEIHGRKLLFLLTQNTTMLPCAEDLGTVPECSFRVLREFAIPGTDIQRWIKDPDQNYAFKEPDCYRVNSIAAVSNHDMTSFNAWWEYEAGTVYAPLFECACLQKGIDFERIKPDLFDFTKSFHDRLRWKEEITEPDLIRILGKPPAEIGDLIDFYRFSFNEKARFWDYLNLPGVYEEKSSPALVQAALEKLSSSASIFSVQMIQDWLSLGDLFQGDSWNVRINFPGTVGKHNWSLVMPVPLEEMKRLSVNREIKKINRESGRI
jgi:4-alpha-glucanotransferase